MKLAGSLGTRLLAGTLATAAVILTTLVALVVLWSDRNLREQASEVSHWSDDQLSDRLLGDAKLVADRIELLRQEVGRRFAAMTQRDDVVRAVLSGNTVAVSELLRPALQLADMDGAIAFDMGLRAISADRVEANLLAANEAILKHPIAHAIREILTGNNPDRPRGFHRSLVFDAALANALASDESGKVVDVFGHPVFDEFGDVSGAIVGYRLMREREATLAAFAQLSSRDLLVIHDGKVISSAGTPFGEVDLGRRVGGRLRSLDATGRVARCQVLEPALQVCAAAPLSDLEHLTEKVIEIGTRHTRSLLATLSMAILLGMGLFALSALVLSDRITKPLVRIARTVGEVSQGDWRTPVSDIHRNDEVGDIARAVVLLERSLEERDQLRSSVVEQNGVLLQREEELREQNDRFDTALNNMSQGLCMYDPQGRLKVCNDRFAAIYAIPPDRIPLGSPVEEVRHATGAGETATGEVQCGSGRSAADHVSTRTLSLPDGRLIEMSVQAMVDGGWVETHEDVTESRSAQARISQMALYDALTGLPNRVLLATRLAEAMEDRRRSGRQVAMLCLDLDDFKGVNDGLGHAAGDDLLKKVAWRLSEVVGPGVTVARLGGDEFAVVDVADEQPSHAIALSDRLIASIKQPYFVSGQVVVVNASIGIAELSPDTEDSDHLLRRADVALYAAKAEGRGRHRLFEHVMEERLLHRRALERDLRQALQDRGIEIHYQPLFSMASGEISGMEALARWPHPERGFVSPGEFIPLAESVGLIDALGEYVLEAACAEATFWPAHIKLAVNVSPIQFRNPDLDRMVAGVLARTGLASHRLELEITESVILHQETETHEILRRLRRLGIRFSMDDFGTGYSSLSSLNIFRFDKLKLDQSFVRTLTKREESAAIVRIVAELGRSLNMTTTAEGVETQEQLQLLRQSGFTEAQGHLFSPALPAAQIRRFIRDREKRLTAA